MPDDTPAGEPAPNDPARSKRIEELRTQLNVLQKKVADSHEPIIREALQQRVNEIMAELGPDLVEKPAETLSVPAAAKKKLDEEELPEPPTPDEQLKADELIRQARVAKMRGQVQEATNFIQQAAQIAPGSPLVLEMLGDELVERKRYGEARVAYGKAVRIDPKNAAIERKYGLMVLRTTTGMSVEAALAMGGDSPFVNPADAIASAKAATIFSILIPGGGQLVLGETKKGLVLLGAWLVCLVFVILMRTDLQGFVRTLAGKHASYDPLVFAPVGIALVIYIAAIGGCASKIKAHWSPPGRTLERPVPPVNLPYE